MTQHCSGASPGRLKAIISRSWAAPVKECQEGSQFRGPALHTGASWDETKHVVVDCFEIYAMLVAIVQTASCDLGELARPIEAFRWQWV